MLVLILCGGRGSRLRGYTDHLPKPLVRIGDQPVLWHVMNLYAAAGHRDFVLCLGHKGDAIRRFVSARGRLVRADTECVEVSTQDGWRIHLLETGPSTMTGGRLRRAIRHVDAETVPATYADGVADIDLGALITSHRDANRVATVTVVHPPPRVMSQPPRVSVVIVNWNTRDLLAQTLTSLHGATQGVSFETIVIDNGSTDGSVDMVQSRWPAVRLVQLPENRGFAAANNIGFGLASGEYVLLLNSDTIVLPTTVPGLVAALDQSDRVGCVGARHLNLDGSLQRSMDQPPSVGHDFMFFCLNDVISVLDLTRLRLVRRWLAHYSLWWGDHDKVTSAGWVNGACMMVRSQVMDQVGVLDESFFIYGEEVDWCTRIRAVGWEVTFIPTAEVVHLGGQAMNQASDRRVYLKYLGMLKYYRKNLPHQVFWFLLMVKAVAGTRILLITALAVLDKLGIRSTSCTWRLVTQEVVRVPHRTIIRAWWQIFKLS